MNKFNEIKLLRLNDVLKIVPIGRSTLWKKVKNGEFPQPIKLSARTTVWKSSEIIE